MARGPFQGTYQANARPTVVMAPDALVYLNGETEVYGCLSCKRKFDIHKYITSIQVDLSVDSCPGSASVSLVVPRHAVDDFYVDGVPVISPMMEIEIFAKGYYLVEGVPQYYPIFWGIVTEVNDSYSGGAHNISISCADILKWWELCKINIHPAWTAPKTASMGWTLFSNVFHGMNPYDVIWTLAQQAMGDVVVGTGSLTAYNGEATQKATFSAALNDMMLYWENRFSRVRNNLLLYGAQGVAVRGDTLWESYRRNKRSGQPFASSAVRRANGGEYGGGIIFDVTSPAVKAFKTNMTDLGVNLWNSEYQTKLEIANAAKEAIGFEFYMDVTGDIVFKPPFYNLDVLPNKPVSWIQDIDIIDWDFSESEAEVVTQIQLAGNYVGGTDWGFVPDVEPMTSVTDWHLLRKYGWRTHQINSEFMGDTMQMFYYGMDVMDRLNARRHRGTVSIPLRPELRLGFPVYVAPKDQIWYVSGISHNIAFGGAAQTTLTLTARRSKFFAPKGIGKLTLTGVSLGSAPAAQGKTSTPSEDVLFKYTARQLTDAGSFKASIGGAASLPAADVKEFENPDSPYQPLVLRHPKTGRTCGFPNVVMAYTRPFTSVNPLSAQKAGSGTTGGQKKYSKVDEKVLEERMTALNRQSESDLRATKDEAVRIKYMQNRYMYGLNSAGVFTYLYDEGGMGAKHAISEVCLIKTNRITIDPKLTDEQQKSFSLKTDGKGTSMIRPVSDERGFEVIGHFRYGRGVSLRDGNLVLAGGFNNTAAKVDLQLALTGDLASALTAQSLGLTTEITTQPNPAASLATLRPEDLQTGAVMLGAGTPDATKPKFSSGGDPSDLTSNFVSTTPLASQEASKLPPSVEATQLSRALTLAEMSVKFQDGSDTACECLLARPDLAFMQQGMKVDLLTETTETGANPNLLTVEGTNPVTEPVPPMAPKSVAEVQMFVDNFLYRLYDALDKPHQTYEDALRGKIGDVGESGVGSATTPVTPPSVLGPPFNAPERFVVGDPLADAALVDSSASGLQETWGQFREDLQRKPVLTALRGIQSVLERKIARLEDELRALDPNSSDPDVQKKIKEKTEELARRKQQLETVILYIATVEEGGDIPSPARALADSFLSGDFDVYEEDEGDKPSSTDERDENGFTVRTFPNNAKWTGR